ncbi:MAG: hypothetical protein Kow00105_05130 [Phycisphaeraceae bacterium]
MRRAFHLGSKGAETGVQLVRESIRARLEALEQRVLLSASPVFELSSLLPVNGGDGSAGVVINGVSLGDRSGVSVSSAGDLNGDGYDDIIMGAFRDSPNGADSGASYVVFGQPGGFPATFQLSTLNGSNGFKINGIAPGDFSGRSVAAAGDVNGDGLDDLLIGSFLASPNGAESGQAYVVYGQAAPFAATLELSTLNGTNGFVIDGLAAGDRLGFSVRGAGDVNGDGIDDFIIGASLADSNGADAGSAYLVFGQTGFGGNFDLTTLNGINGFRIDGVSATDQLGISVNGAGDINGDGIDDVIVGAYQTDTHGVDSGSAYVIFGSSGGFSAVFDPATLNGTNGFTLHGGATLDNAGRSVSSAGDFNGDGFADILIGAPDADGDNPDSGSAYVVFGSGAVFPATINLSSLTGADGFKLNGIDTGDRAGLSVASAGDVNADGLDDLLVAADRAAPNGIRSGETYLVLGRSSAMPASINLSGLSGNDGFVLNGINPSDSSGTAIRSAGDVDGDGFDDFLIGAFLADPNGSESGQSYLIFGGDFSSSVTDLGSPGDDAILGTSSGDVIVSGRGHDVLTGNGGADVLIAGQGDDELIIADLAFKRVDGGSGSDTLTVDGTGITLDLTTISDSRIRDIETIDISGGANLLILNHQEVLNLSGSSNTLTVIHDISGMVNIGSGWTQTSSQIVNGNQETIYTQGNATLIVIELADLIDPVVTINSLTTTLRSPQLTGTVSDLDPSVTVQVTVDGTTYDAVNNGDGTWTLPAGLVTPDLVDGVYDIQVVATDSSDNVGTDQTSNELVVDNQAPIVTVDPLITSSQSPELTGTINDIDPQTTISVQIDGNNYNAINNSDGTWVLPAGTVMPGLADGVYEVAVVATDTLGHVGNDASTNELTIDTVAPVVTINSPGTQNTGSPDLTGTVTDSDLNTIVVVTITGVGQFNAVNNGDGTWVLPAGTITPELPEGGFTVEVAATDAAGNQGTLVSPFSLTIDTPPVVTVDPLTTSDQSPQLTGTIVDADTTAAVVITVNGNAFNAVNNGDGTWTLPDYIITPLLPDGVYDVTVTATDAGGNIGNDATSDELVIDTTAPSVTVDSLATSDATPELTGTVSDAQATIEVTVDGQTHQAINHGDGTWTLPDNTITVALADGVYDVMVSATNLAQPPAVGNDATVNELRIDTINPVVTFNNSSTADTTPELTGTLIDADPNTTVSVTISGAGTFNAVNNGDGTWTLPDNTITPALAVGMYDVIVTALDSAGNVDVETALSGLEITNAPFTITVDPLSTNDSTPQLTGTIDDATAQVLVTVNGIPYAAINNGDGTWTLPDDTITPALADGNYDVLAQGTIAGPVTLSDSTTDELLIDTTAPVVTVTPLTTSDTNPELVGTVDDPAAIVSVTVNNNTYSATNNGDGTWTLADNTITPLLPVGTYDITVTATDSLGNVGSDTSVDELIITNPTVPSLDLVDLHSSNGGDGTQGVVFNGVNPGDWAGYAVSSAGDFNGDGYDDLIIGARDADPISNNDGTVYIVFGMPGGFPAEIDLGTLNGTDGFAIHAEAVRDSLGVSVASAGDVNGDGLDDVIIGADLADPNGNRSGSVYVIYGSTGPFAPTFDLSTLNGTNGYKFNGAATDDRTGFSVNTAGDINGDGLNDVVIGTLTADDGVTPDTGRAYVIYGSTSAMPALLTPASLNGTNGLILTGPETGGRAGFSVSSLGDVNGDGIDDLRIGAPDSTVGSNVNAGKTYIVFGSSSLPAEVLLGALNGTDGFVIEGAAADDDLGFSGAELGDINGDGFADILVSAPASSDPNRPGEAYVIFGQTGPFSASISVSTLNGTNGFALIGVDNGDDTGFNVSGVGDVNGDGFDDLLIGAPMAAGGVFENGEAFLFFGHSGAYAASIDLATLPGNGGMRFDGAGVLDHAGRYVSRAGDVNGDGFDDFVIGARDADVNANNDAGRAYLIFGRDFLGTVTHTDGAAATTLTGSSARDAMMAGPGDDELIGNGGPDVLSAGQGDDVIAVSDTAFIRVNGGNGFDTLRLEGSGISLDLTAISDHAIQQIEQIDIRGTGSNSLVLDVREVLNISDSSNTLLVLSTASDTVDIGTGWTAVGQETIDGKNFGVFTQGNATLKLHIEPQTIAGDLDGDGFVGIADLNIVLGNWNQNVTAGSLAEGDPSGDGFVGIEDLNTVLGNWNAGTSPATQATASSSTASQAQPVQVSAEQELAKETTQTARTEPKVSTKQTFHVDASGNPTHDPAIARAAWDWMHDRVDIQRSAFGSQDAVDSALDLAEPEDAKLPRLF